MRLSIESSYDREAVAPRETRTVDSHGKAFTIPKNYMALQPMDDDPEGSDVFGFGGKEADAVAFFTVVPDDDALPFGDTGTVVDGIHGVLGENQGLVRVGTGKSLQNGVPYIYSIVRTEVDPRHTQYVLTFQFSFGAKALNIEAHFDETGEGSRRTAAVWSIGQDRKRPWARDPYTPEFTLGRPMTQAEEPRWDASYPDSAIALCRTLVRCLAENN